MTQDVQGHMSEDYRWREFERRMDRVERATELVPLIQRDLEALRKDMEESKDDTRSLRRALYTMAISFGSSALVFAYSVQELFK